MQPAFSAGGLAPLCPSCHDERSSLVGTTSRELTESEQQQLALLNAAAQAVLGGPPRSSLGVWVRRPHAGGDPALPSGRAGPRGAHADRGGCHDERRNVPRGHGPGRQAAQPDRPEQAQRVDAPQSEHPLARVQHDRHAAARPRPGRSLSSGAAARRARSLAFRTARARGAHGARRVRVRAAHLWARGSGLLLRPVARGRGAPGAAASPPACHQRRDRLPACARRRPRQTALLASRKGGRPSNWRLPDELRSRAIVIVRERYTDFGPLLANEKLAQLHGARVSKETLRHWLIEVRRGQGPLRVNRGRRRAFACRAPPGPRRAESPSWSYRPHPSAQLRRSVEPSWAPSPLTQQRPAGRQTGPPRPA